MEINKIKVKHILEDLAKSIDAEKEGILNSDGTLNVRKFNELTQVKEAIEKLRALGVTRGYLMDYFQIAGMLLTF